MALAISPTSKAFGSVTADTSSSPQAFVLTPDVTTDSVFSVVITGANASEFSTDETLDTTTGQYSYQGGSLVTAATTFHVTFSPVTTGSKTATLEVHYNGSGEAGTLLVPLTGTGD